MLVFEGTPAGLVAVRSTLRVCEEIAQVAILVILNGGRPGGAGVAGVRCRLKGEE